MAKEKVEVMISGGKATAAPPLGPALGPLKINIGNVVTAINEKTKDFAGMQVPVTVEVDTETKEFTISIGTPPASALIKQEAGIKKAAGNPKTDLVSDLRIEQIIKIAKMKEDALLGKDLKQKVKEICGSCQSMGVMVEGKIAHDTIVDINAGKFDAKILSGKTELSDAERKELEAEKVHLQEEIKEKYSEFVAKGKVIMNETKSNANKDIRKALIDGGIPQPIVDELAPDENAKEK